MLCASAIAVLTGLVLTVTPVTSSAQAAVPVALRVMDERGWDVEAANVAVLEARALNGRQAAQGLFVGAILGAAAGALVGYAMCDNCDELSGPLLYTATVGAVVGALVGLVVGSSRGSRAASLRSATARLVRGSAMRAPLPDESWKLTARPAS
jgi:uncharacterized membrane protein YeaQ/YmgE (transglycosylase-associated protein family)